MNVRDVIACAALLGAVIATVDGEAESRERLNIVIIVADDLGWADVGYHGSPIKTPHIDHLCRTGVELDRHYVAPMCTPTRVGLLTGRYWSRFGNTAPSNARVLPWDTPTLATILKSAGYHTAITGKWHLGSKPEWGPRKFGFDHSHGSLAGGVNPWSHLYKHGPFTRTWHRNDTLIDEEGHVTDLITNEAVRLIRSGFGGRPFFLYVPYTAVHTPFDEPQKYLERCRHIDADRRQYAASCVHLDDGIGQILQALDESGERDRTLIVFFSDNGGTNGDDSRNYPDTKPTTKVQGLNHPLRGWKTQVWEGGIRVPACVNWPGRLKPHKVPQPVHVTDWMPTIAAAIGVDLDPSLKLDGRDIRPLLLGQTNGESLDVRVLYTQGVRGRDAAVHRGVWKLVTTRDEQQIQLFHLESDPQETKNVAADQAAIVEELLGLLRRARQADDDALPDAEK